MTPPSHSLKPWSLADDAVLDVLDTLGGDAHLKGVNHLLGTPLKVKTVPSPCCSMHSTFKIE